MTCRQTRREILEDALSAAAQQHLEGCLRCACEWQQMEQVVALLRDHLLRAEPPHDLFANVRVCLEDPPRSHPRSLRLWRTEPKEVHHERPKRLYPD